MHCIVSQEILKPPSLLSLPVLSSCPSCLVESWSADRGGGQVQRGGDSGGQLQRHHQPGGAQRRRGMES